MKRSKRIRREHVITYLAIFMIVGLGIGLLYFVQNGMTGFAVYTQSNQSDFDEGIYNNTEWNGSAIVLAGNNLTGTYVSKVFDAGNKATWNSLSLIQKGTRDSFNSYLVSAVHLGENATEVFELDGAYYLANMKDSSKRFYLNFSDNLISKSVLKLYAKKNKGITIGIYNESDSSGNLPLGIFTVSSTTGEWYNITLNISGQTNSIWIGEGTESGTDPEDEFDYIYAEIPEINLTFYVKNCSSQDCSDAEFIEVDLNNINVQSRYFQYKISFSTPDSSITPLVESVSIDYDLINSPPTITLVNPQDGATYGSNESLELSFSVSDNEENLDSCWYKLENQNTTIPDCLNTTFNVSGNGDYILSIYANDTHGELAFDSANFSVQIGAPAITLSAPINAYLSSANVIFRYTPADIDLDSCELWGNFDGIFKINQTDYSPISGSENTFNLTLLDGDYLWNIKCNDNIGNSAFNGNKTFHIDTLNPNISLIGPTGTKSSRTLTLSWNIIEKNPFSCWYNVYRGGNIEIANTSVNCSDNLSSFYVTIDADFILNFYANDSAGNLASESSSFSVSTSSTEVIIPPSTGGSSSGGGGGGSYSVSGSLLPQISIEKLSDLIVNSGDRKKLSLTAKNTGTIFVNDCALKGLGEYSSWFSSSETKNLAAGEEYEFNFNLNIPETMGAGEYPLSISLECKEISESDNFIVEIIEKKLGFDLIEVKRDNNENVNVIYSLEELSGIGQNVELQFLLFGVENEKIAEIKDIKKIPANSKQEFEIIIPVDSSLKGELNLLVNLNSETYSTFVQENIILGSPIMGFAIFGENTNTDNTLSFIFIILFLIFAFIMIRKIIKLKRKKK